MPYGARLTTRAEREALRAVKRACYSGLDSVTLRQEVVRRAASLIPAEAHALMATDPGTGLFTHGFAEGLPQDFVRQYMEEVYPGEACEFIYLARSGQVTSTENSEPFQEVLRSGGLEYCVHAAATLDDEMWASWCLFRERSGSAFAEKETHFLRAAAPHVAHGMRAAAAIEAAHAGVTAEVGSPPGVVVVDAQNRIQLRSGDAAIQLADLADVGIPSKLLPYAVVSVLARLREAVTCAADPKGLGASLRAQGRSGQWYTLQAALAEPDESGESSRVVVIEPAAPNRPPPVLARYGLTARQKEVLLLAAKGESTKRISARLGLSPHTVQSHLNQACDKVGVGGRKALLAKMFVEDFAPRLFEESAEPAASVRHADAATRERRAIIRLS